MTNQTGIGWQRPKGGRTYFYRTVKLPDGRRVKKYFGRGDEAHTESAKLADETKRSQRFAVTRRLTAEFESLMKQLALQVDTLDSANLILDGYHNPNGRGWRLNSMSTSHREQKRTKGDVVSDDNVSSSPPHRQKRTLEEFVRAAKGGDHSVVAELFEWRSTT